MTNSTAISFRVIAETRFDLPRRNRCHFLLIRGIEIKFEGLGYPPSTLSRLKSVTGSAGIPPPAVEQADLSRYRIVACDGHAFRRRHA
jgi:hypothetical protein